jgi:hypothetical protein
MVYSLGMTNLLRQYRYVDSDVSMHGQMMREFNRPDGVSRLSEALGVSPTTAYNLLCGNHDPALARVAYYYGSMPNEESATGWRVLPMLQEPCTPGPTLLWTPRLVDYLTELFRPGSKQPSIAWLAMRMDTTYRRLRDGMRRHHIPIPPKGQEGDWIDTRATWKLDDLQLA